MCAKKLAHCAQSLSKVQFTILGRPSPASGYKAVTEEFRCDTTDSADDMHQIGKMCFLFCSTVIWKALPMHFRLCDSVSTTVYHISVTKCACASLDFMALLQLYYCIVLHHIMLVI